jgi:hypothetical protein
MGLLGILCRKNGRAESYFSSTHRLETLYSEIVDEYRLFFVGWKRVNWERYRKYSDAVCDNIIKPLEWNWLNKRLIEENLVPRRTAGQLRQIIGDYTTEKEIPLFSIYIPKSNQ